MKALVTGDRGFLGRHFRAALEKRGYDVDGCDPASPGTQLVVPGESYGFKLRFNDARVLFENSLTYYDLVIHCAAVVGGRAKIEGDPLALAVNLELDAAMFRWAARTRPMRVVYISSSAVYPVVFQGWSARRDRHMGWLREEDVNLEEDGLWQPDQTYGWSKLVGEHLAGQLRRSGVFTTVVRPFSGYGVDQDEDYPFRAFIERARRGDDPFEIWGDGDQVRDFIHVSDVIGATLAAVEAGVDGPLNICTGRIMSFRGLAELVADAAGYEPRFKTLKDKPMGVRWRVGDPTRMLEIYVPEVDVEDALKKVFAP